MLNFKKLRQGHEGTFMTVVELYTPRIRAYLTPKIYGLQDLDDIVQEVFIAAYKGRKTLQDPEKIEAWLKGIARNKLKLYYRSQFRKTKMTAGFKDFISLSIEDNFDDHPGKEEQSILKKCIQKLPEKLKLLITQRHLSGFRVKDLARQAGCSESQISVQLFRAREKLKQCVENQL